MNQIIDDTSLLSCTISDAYNVKDHTEYSLSIHRGPLDENKWRLTKRYSDFSTLNDCLADACVLLQLPPKRVFGNMTHEFIAERQKLLQIFIDNIMSNIVLKNSLVVKKFLDPKMYSHNIAESHLHEVAMFMRSNAEWQLLQPLAQIGTRIQKSYIMVKQKQDSNDIKMILSYVRKGSNFILDNKQVISILKFFANVQHDHIFPIEYAVPTLHGIIHIRNLGEKGTLRDNITQAKPLDNHLKKYGCSKKHLFFTLEVIRSFSVQILLTLKCFHRAGLFYGNLHAGNVLVNRCTCYLLDTENVMAGVPWYYREFITHHRKINTIENIDVYCYGHLLYEMAYGVQLNTSSCDFFSSETDSSIREILNLILSGEACKKQLPTIDELLSKRLFADQNIEEQKPLKVPSKILEIITKYQDHVLNKLKHDQKAYYKMRRLQETENFHASDDQKNLRKQRQRKHNQRQTNATKDNKPDNDCKNEQTQKCRSATEKDKGDTGVEVPDDEENQDVFSEEPLTPKVVTPSSEKPERSALLDSIVGFKKNNLRAN